MICLDRRVVLHWKHTMVHLINRSGTRGGGEARSSVDS
jgi:hypothetical protein